MKNKKPPLLPEGEVLKTITNHFSKAKKLIIYARKGTKVTIIKKQGNMLIVEKDGTRFSCKEEDIK